MECTTNKGRSSKRNDTIENERGQFCFKKEECDIFIPHCTVNKMYDKLASTCALNMYMCARNITN